jgi:hypothetical protein
MPAFLLALGLTEPNVVISGPDVGKGSECKGALHLAHVIFEDGLWAEGLRQVETVLDLERLAERSLLGAGAHYARGHASGVAGFNTHITNL